MQPLTPAAALKDPAAVGEKLGATVGTAVGERVGLIVVGEKLTDGLAVGAVVGLSVGEVLYDGMAVGAREGEATHVNFLTL